VLVTGATGGLGRVLVRHLLAQGRQVLATGRNATIGSQLGGCRFIAVDLTCDRLSPLLQEVSSVYHLAALASPWGRLSDFERANIYATQRLLEAAEQAACTSFIYTSTPSIYTCNQDQLGITEASALPTTFTNHYTRTKYRAEQLVRHHPGKMATCVLRPKAIVSAFDTALLPRLIRAGRRGRMPLPRGGAALVELTDARDVATALVAAEQFARSHSGDCFNISSGQPRAFGAIVRQVFDTLNKQVRYFDVPPGLFSALGSALETVAQCIPGQPEPALTRYSALAASWSQTFDLSAAKERLGWQPRFTPEQSIQWALTGHPIE
jgi:2-alkyl-3-oxoalkanoate reductase